MPKGVVSRKRGAFGRKPRPRVITTKTITTGGGTGLPLGPPRTGGFFGVGARRARGELKTIDSGTQSVSGVSNATGSIVLINGSATGTDYTNRIGRKTINRSILLRFTVTPLSTTTRPSGDCLRVMLIYDTQTNSAAPIITDILNAASIQSPMNLNNRDRFQVLMDKHYPMNPDAYAAGAVTSGNPVLRQIKIYKKMWKETIYSGTTAAVGSVQSGALWLVALAQQNAAIFWQYDTRVRFEDA